MKKLSKGPQICVFNSNMYAHMSTILRFYFAYLGFPHEKHLIHSYNDCFYTFTHCTVTVQ